jgi:hypothetical protein
MYEAITWLWRAGKEISYLLSCLFLSTNLYVALISEKHTILINGQINIKVK